MATSDHRFVTQKETTKQLNHIHSVLDYSIHMRCVCVCVRVDVTNLHSPVFVLTVGGGGRWGEVYEESNLRERGGRAVGEGGNMQE